MAFPVGKFKSKKGKGKGKKVPPFGKKSGGGMQEVLASRIQGKYGKK